MDFEQRSYGGKLFRPTPLIHTEDNGQLIVVATPWGSQEAAEKSIQIIVDYYMSARQDQETTSPFETITSLSAQANTLRTSILLANETVYREENKQEYSTACELFVGSFISGTLYWAQIGQPHLLLLRQGKIYPLSLSFDYSIDYGLFLPPVPKQILGLYSHISPFISSAKIYRDDEILLVSRSKYLSLFNTPIEQDPITELSKNFSQEDPNAPFWIGHILL